MIRLTSLSGIANRYIALTPGARTATKELDDGATLDADTTTDVVDLDQLFNTLDPTTRRGLQDVIQGFATQYEGKGAEAGRVGRVLQPAAVDLAPRSSTSSPRTRARSTRLHRQLLARGDGASPSAATTSPTSSATPTRRRARSPPRTSRSSRALGAAADHAAARQHDVREPARDARRPRRAGRRVQARDQGPRAVPARAAPARARRAADDPRPAHARHAARRRQRPRSTPTRKLPALAAGRQRRPSRTRPQALQKRQPVLEFIRPYTPDLVGWLRDFGQAPPTTTPTATTRASSRSSTRSSSPTTPRGGVLTPHPADSQRFDGLADRRRSSAARAPRASAPPDGSAPWTDDGNLGPDDCDPSLVLPGP